VATGNGKLCGLVGSTIDHRGDFGKKEKKKASLGRGFKASTIFKQYSHDKFLSGSLRIYGLKSLGNLVCNSVVI
jgi:hypothetical protein